MTCRLGGGFSYQGFDFATCVSALCEKMAGSGATWHSLGTELTDTAWLFENMNFKKWVKYKCHGPLSWVK